MAGAHSLSLFSLRLSYLNIINKKIIIIINSNINFLDKDFYFRIKIHDIDNRLINLLINKTLLIVYFFIPQS